VVDAGGAIGLGSAQQQRNTAIPLPHQSGGSLARRWFEEERFAVGAWEGDSDAMRANDMRNGPPVLLSAGH